MVSVRGEIRLGFTYIYGYIYITLIVYGFGVKTSQQAQNEERRNEQASSTDS